MNSMKISDAAAEQIQKHLQKYTSYSAMRLSVNPSGCNGYAYDFKPDYILTDCDTVFVDNGISVLVDKKDDPFLGDITIDYIKDGFTANFDIQNSLVKNECGCGKSWNI